MIADRGFRHRLFRAWLMAEAGDRRYATELVDAALADPRPLLAGFGRRYGLALLAEVAAVLEHRPAAARVLEWLGGDRRHGECIVMGANAYFGSIRRYLGLAALTLGDVDAAVGHQEAALVVHERMRAAGWAARSRSDLARALRARGREGDTERAVAARGGRP